MTLADGERVHAEAVVCAMPAGPLRAVSITGLSDARLASLRAQRHALAAKVVVAYEESFWQRRRAERARRDRVAVRLDLAAGPGVLSLLVPPERFAPFIAAPPRARRQTVLDGLAALYGERAAEPGRDARAGVGEDPYTLGYISSGRRVT